MLIAMSDRSGRSTQRRQIHSSLCAHQRHAGDSSLPVHHAAPQHRRSRVLGPGESDSRRYSGIDRGSE